MEAVLAIFVSFILSGLIGNHLLQRWQHRTWLLQQRQLGLEKEYLSLKQLTEELSKAMGVRVYRMRRLSVAIRNLSEEELKFRLAEYDKALIDWNESLGFYFVRLTFFASYGFTTTLDQRVQPLFANAGKAMEDLIKRRFAGERIRAAETAAVRDQLDFLQVQVGYFMRDLVGRLEQVRREVYFGRRTTYTSGDLRNFSTWELVKALFARDVDSFSVLSPPDDLISP